MSKEIKKNRESILRDNEKPVMEYLERMSLPLNLANVERAYRALNKNVSKNGIKKMFEHLNDKQRQL